MKRLQIGVIGYAGCEEYPQGEGPKSDIFQSAERIGFLLAQKGAIVVTGGKSGVMEYAARGAKKAGGVTVGIVKGKKRFTSNDFTDIEIITGMEYNGMDELNLIMMCDALIIVGGGAGTLQEITIAYRNNKPLIALKNSGGWADSLIGNYLDERKTLKVESAVSPEEAIELAIKLANEKVNKT
jgi:uncharacterized protein (TIGR00725 family)